MKCLTFFALLCSFAVAVETTNNKQIIGGSHLSNDELTADCNRNLLAKAPSECAIDWDVQDVPYTETDIVLNGVISGFDSTACLNTDHIGFEVVSSKLSFENEEIQYVISLECREGRVSGRVIDSSNDYHFDLYGLKTEYGVFISPVSVEQAEHSYCLYKRLENAGSDDDYNQYLRSSFPLAETIVNDNEPSYANSPHAIPLDYVYGYLFWKDDNGVVRPLKGVLIELCSGKESGIVRASTFSWSDGYYAFPAPEDKNAYHHLRIYAASEEYQIYANRFDPYGWYYPTECFEGRGKSRTYTFQVRSNNGDINRLGAAFEITQALYYGVKYISLMSNTIREDTIREKIPVIYPYYNLKEGAFYGGPLGINCGLYIYRYWDVILHEFGHYVQLQHSINLQPLFKTHYFDKYACAGDKDGSIRLAWGEAWPTFFANLVTVHFSEEIHGVEFTNDCNYDGARDDGSPWLYDLENDGGGMNLGYGECCEGNVVHVLYDMWDGDDAEEFDQLSLDDETMWDLVTNSKAITFSAFINYCYNDWRVDADKLGRILSHYGMAAPFVEVTNLTSSSRDIPTIHWGVSNTSGSHDKDYPSDYYTLEVYDWGEHVILTKDIRNELSYTFTPSEWNQLLLSSNTEFGARVTCYQTLGVDTGGYRSDVFWWRKPKKNFETRFSYKAKDRVVETLVEDLGPSSKANIYISFDTAGYKFFTTAGAEDTKMRLYSPTGALLQEDDNSGYSTNAMVVRYIAKSTSYYRLEITRYNPSSNLPFRLLVCASCPDLVEPGWSFSSIEELNAASGSLEVGTYCVANYVCLMRFTPKKNGTLTLIAESAFDNYLYLIDLSSPTSMFVRSGREREYDDDGGEGSNAKLEKDVQYWRTYLVCYSQYNPSSDIGGDGFSADLKLTFLL